MAVQAHQRYDRFADSDAELLVNAERRGADEEAYDRIRGVLRTQPELAAVLDRVQRDVEELYVALVRSGYRQDAARSDLRTLAQLLAAAAADRRAAEQDRAHAQQDRTDAKRDRDNARSGRQQSAIDRAPSSGDYDWEGPTG